MEIHTSYETKPSRSWPNSSFHCIHRLLFTIAEWVFYEDEDYTNNNYQGPLALACFTGLTFYTDTLVYFAITLVLNLTLTSLILLRLWQCKVQLRETLGNGYGKHYSVLSIVFIESASMNAICSVLLLISSVYGVVGPVGHPMGLLLNVWVAITPAVQVTSSHSIIHSHSNTYVFCFSKACSNYLIIYRGTRDRKSTRLNSSHSGESRMPSSA